MKSDGAYNRIKNNPHEKDGAVISDVPAKLTGAQTERHYPKAIRQIKYYDKEYHHAYEFITNNMEMGDGISRTYTGGGGR